MRLMGVDILLQSFYEIVHKRCYNNKIIYTGKMNLDETFLLDTPNNDYVFFFESGVYYSITFFRTPLFIFV